VNKRTEEVLKHGIFICPDCGAKLKYEKNQDKCDWLVCPNNDCRRAFSTTSYEVEELKN
jgi:ssDNA-binding Zn-finger/Zn-ribbon topoisomerase 1